MYVYIKIKYNVIHAGVYTHACACTRSHTCIQCIPLYACQHTNILRRRSYISRERRQAEKNVHLAVYLSTQRRPETILGSALGYITCAGRSISK